MKNRLPIVRTLALAALLSVGAGCTYMQETGRLRGEQAYWNAEYGAAQDQRVLLEEQLADLKTRRNTKQSRLSEVNAQLRALSPRQSSASSNVASLRREKAQLEAEVAKLESAIAVLY